MTEHECLRILSEHDPATDDVKHGWKGQIKDNLLWQACCEAVASGDHGRLDQWREGLKNAKGVIAGPFGPHHVTAAFTILDCAEVALAAKAVELALESRVDTSAYDWSVDDLIPVLHTAAQIVGYRCDCDEDHGALRVALPARDTFRPKTAISGDKPSPSRFVDVVFPFLARKASFLSFPMSWGWDVTRALLKQRRTIVHRHEIPVAGVEGNEGFLASFVLEVLEPGCGEVFHDPQDAFHTHADAEFVFSMKDAWQGACALVQGTNVSKCDGRWRLLQDWLWKEEERKKLSPATEANDRSASGAAAWGWCFSLTGTVPDVGVIVVAQVDENNIRLLKGFGGEGVGVKTKAIADKEGFDTIVVADEKDKGEAEATLRAVGKFGLIRVGPPWQ